MPQKNLHYSECYFRPLFYRYLYTIIISFFLLKMCTKASSRGTTGILKTHLTSGPSHYLQASAELQSSVQQS